MVTAAILALLPALHVEDGHFRDQDGGVVVLRGFNVTGDAKVPPFRTVTGEGFFAPIADRGANVVRLLFTWEAYEAEAGAYDESYLDYIVAAADAAEAAGLYVIVDFHQDAFSRHLLGGCGDGFPEWAIPPEIARAEPDNGEACADWGQRMVGDADVLAAWQAFHADAGGVQTAYLAMIGRVAARLADHPAVIGYDLVNEPRGDEVTQLPALYVKAAAAIRAVDADAIVFCEPQALVSSGMRSELAAPVLDNQVYAPHFYDPFVLLTGMWPGSPPTQAFGFMRAKAEELGGPLFVGEYGAPAGTYEGDLYLHAFTELLDETFASAAQWNYTPGWTAEGKDGWNREDLSVVDDQLRARDNLVVRPYPRRVAGEPISFVYTRADARTMTRPSVELHWQGDPARGETEIVLDAQAVFGLDRPYLYPRNATCLYADRRVICTAQLVGEASVRVHDEPPETVDEEDAGCSCRVGARDRLDAWPLALLVLLLRRRR